MLSRCLFSCLAVLGVTVLLSGCCVRTHCGDCPAAIQLDVVDAANGDPVPAVTVSGERAGGCYVEETSTQCYLYPEAGSYVVTVSAPGYQTVAVTIDVPESDGGGCCDCGYEGVTRTVELAPSA